MPSVTLTRIDKNADGSIDVVVGKFVRHYDSLAHMRQCIKGAFTQDDLIDLMLAAVLTKQPALGNPSAFTGHGLSIDFTAPLNWGTFT